MQANSTLRSAFSTYYRNCYPKSSPSLPLSQSQTCNRRMHTITLRTDASHRSHLSHRFLTSEWKRNNIASGFLIISRNESTTTKIPPLSSEVFSRTAETTETLRPVISATSNTGESSVASSAVPLHQQGSTIVSSTVPDAAASAAVSNTEALQQSLIWENIPEPPAIPNSLEELATTTLPGVEPSFESLGLGGWTPSGIVQQCLEYVHCTVGLPWWGSILVGTICVRLLVFPLVIKSQRNAAKMNNNMPQMQAIQLKMTEARQTGNSMMAAKYSQEMMLFMKEKDISPFKSILVPIAMAPIFISFFFGLRKMANLPVDSMREGGLWWFTDLTMADPYCLLPLLTSVTLWITMEVGVDGVQLNASNHGQLMRYFMRAIPVIMFPLTMNFPAAILCYWVSTNAISLTQVSLLKIPSIRSSLKIEPLRRHKPDTLPMKKKGFVDSFKDSWTNVKITKEMEDRVRYDDISFRRAGKGPIPKTYKYDPTQVSAAQDRPAAVQAKQKR